MTVTDTSTTDEAEIEQLDETVEPDTEPEAVETDDDQGDDEPEEDAETFDRKYVEKLRRENQRYRERAGEADTLAQRLHTQLVAATGRLADPTDLPFDAAHLDDAEALTAAVDELLARKPHLASRRPMGDIGQGATRTEEAVDLAALLRGRA